MKEVILLNGGT